MMDIKLDISGLQPMIGKEEEETLATTAASSYKALLKRTGKGNDFLGWMDLPAAMNQGIIERIQQTAARLKAHSEWIVVAGIGGSYLGARAVIEALKHSFSSFLDERKHPEIVYAGHHLSSDYFADLLDLLDKKDYSLIVISKSGTTTEPAVAFRILKAHLENKYGKQAAQGRIVAITDREKGSLKKLADKEGYEQYVVPDDVGGRYSVMTPVGMLPVASAGFNISGILSGARQMKEFLVQHDHPADNIALQYVMARNACYRKGYFIEILVNYEPRLFYIAEWWKQLFGESEGKEGKGIFPASVSFTTDLHSMGQYLQEGERKLFETVLSIEKSQHGIKVPDDPENADGLNFIAGKSFSEINLMAELGTTLAHRDGGVPNIRIKIPELNENTIGQLLYFFEFSCAVSGYMLGVNPFDQPGVEAYKKNMFALMGKPGFEAQTAEIKNRLK